MKVAKVIFRETMGFYAYWGLVMIWRVRRDEYCSDKCSDNKVMKSNRR